MILDNAHILTMDEALPRISALAIAGGKVLGGVDSREDAIASHAHERVDLDGMTVVPGFVDSHVHMRGWAIASTLVNVRSAQSSMELLARVSEAAARPHDAGAWLIGHGWLDAQLPAHSERLTRLNEATCDRPCMLQSRDGHAVWINSLALQMLDLALDNLSGDDSIVERDLAGAVTGIVRERAAMAIRERVPGIAPTTAQLAAAVRAAAREGVTCIHDVDGAAGLRAWRQLERERGLQLRVVQHLTVADLDHAAALGIDSGFGSDRLVLGGVKVFVDGTLSSGTAWLHDAHSEHAQPIVVTDPDELANIARRAGDAGFPLVIHAIGDAACTASIDALETTRDHWNTTRAMPRIEHAQLMRNHDMQRCAALGIALSIQPTHLISDRDLAEVQWSHALHDAYAWNSMIEAGCTLVLGSDAPIEPLHPRAALHAATVRDGGAFSLDDARGSWRAEESIDSIDALRACTSWAADAAGLSSLYGRLTPGRAADLVVLSNDPTVTAWKDIEIVATMVGGRWTYGAANIAQVRS